MSKESFILCHYDGRLGKIDYLEKYLRKNGYLVSRLLHPLDDYGKLSTSFVDTDGSEKAIKRKAKGLRNYWEDLLLSTQIIRKKRIDVGIALSNFDTLPIIFCRKILHKKIDRIIYYPSDYSGKRFNNWLLNVTYVLIERLAIHNSDLVVSNTHRAEHMRISLGLDRAKSTIIPNGVRMPLPKPVFYKKHISKHAFVYVGDVNVEHGLYDLIKVLSPHINKLVIIGSGKDWDRTIKLAKTQSFELETHFKKDREYVLRYLQKFEGFGLAPYNRTADWTYYCSPVKVGEYIACGVPVLMSDVPEIAETVRRENYGITYGRLHIKSLLNQINTFNTQNYYIRAKKFYAANNAEYLFGKLGI